MVKIEVLDDAGKVTLGRSEVEGDREILLTLDLIPRDGKIRLRGVFPEIDPGLVTLAVTLLKPLPDIPANKKPHHTPEELRVVVFHGEFHRIRDSLQPGSVALALVIRFLDSALTASTAERIRLLDDMIFRVRTLL